MVQPTFGVSLLRPSERHLVRAEQMGDPFRGLIGCPVVVFVGAAWTFGEERCTRLNEKRVQKTMPVPCWFAPTLRRRSTHP